MAGLADFRKAHPEYDDMSDQALSDALYAKFYHDMPREQFDAKMGTSAPHGALYTPIDMARSVPGGLAKGVAATAGLGGQIRDMLTSPLPQGTRNIIDTVMRPLPPTLLGGPSSDELNAMFAAPTGGYYEPKTTLGKFAETAASFAPAAIGGPESLLQRIATRVLAPAVGAIGGGDIAKAVGLPEQVGNVGGAVAGGVLGDNPRAITSIFAKSGGSIPTLSDLRNAANAAYSTVDNSGMVVSTPAVQGLLNDTQNQLATLGFHPKATPKTADALGILQDAANSIAPGHTLKGLDTIRKITGNLIGEVNPTNKTDKMMLRRINDNIDDFVQNLQPAQVLGGNVDQNAINALDSARDLWGRLRKAETIGGLIDKANLNSRSMVGNLPGLGYGDALRTQFRRLANNERGISRFTPEEQDAIRGVATGGPGENALRLLGKLSPDQTIPLLSELGAAFYDPKMLALPVAGVAGKAGATAITARNARLAEQLMRTGGNQAATPSPSLIQLLRSVSPQKAAALALPAYTEGVSPSAAQSAAMANAIFGGGATNIPLASMLLQGAH